MNNKKVLFVVSGLLVLIGVCICFGVAIFTKEEVEVRIERAGVCNPLKPVEEKEVKITDEDKRTLRLYWEDTDKEIEPEANEFVDSLIGDYKLFVGEDTILFNLNIGYVSYNGKYVDISDDFTSYITELVEENDTELEDDEDSDDNEECCSCCPDLDEDEVCIDACCPCSEN